MFPENPSEGENVDIHVSLKDTCKSYKAECTKLHYLEVRSYRVYKTALP